MSDKKEGIVVKGFVKQVATSMDASNDVKTVVKVELSSMEKVNVGRLQDVFDMPLYITFLPMQRNLPLDSKKKDEKGKEGKEKVEKEKEKKEEKKKEKKK